jgi:hypothetical protein
MIHTVAALLHFATTIRTYTWVRIADPELASAIPAAVSHGWIETKGPDGSLDYFWIHLTPKGRELVLESLNAMEAVS